MDFKKELTTFLKKETKLKEIQLETPPDPRLGDYAFPCYQLSKKQKKQPQQIAQELKTIKPPKFIEKIESNGPYLNLFINKTLLVKTIIKKILKEKNNYGKQKNNKKILLEYPSPNTNKPLHLGHLRNIFLGQSLTNLLKHQGNKVIQTNLMNDRGIHICKSMLAYKKYGKNKTPKKDPDKFVGDFYILFNKKQNKNLEQEAQELLKKWENKDKETIALWKKMNSWTYEGFDKTFKTLNLKINKNYYESKIYSKGKDIILKALKNKQIKRDKTGAIYINLKPYNLPNKILLRADQTTVYITQDIYLANLKQKDYHPDSSIYIVGSEQNLHFKQLFKILEILNYKWAKNLYHLSHGMIYLPKGRMKSREGTVVDADDILEEMTNLAKIEVKKRHKKLPKKELEKRAKSIGIGALRYHFLKIDPVRDITYNPQEAISFEGDTGPYIQYTLARASSILAKTKANSNNIDYNLLTEWNEYELIKQLYLFPEILQSAVQQLKPNLLANYAYNLAKAFTEFYHNCPVLTSEPELKKARIALVKATKQVLSNALTLLNITPLEQM